MVMTSLLTSSQVQMTILGLLAFPDYPCSYYLWRQAFISTLSGPRLNFMSHLTMTSNVPKNSEGLELALKFLWNKNSDKGFQKEWSFPENQEQK